MAALTNRIATVFLFLALCAGAISARATAVVTLTTSPNIVSNTYNGVITLQINGLTNGVTNVVVQKYLDVNTNGVIDSGDLLVQQFRLAVGQANVFTNLATMTPVTVTNFMPGDTSSATDQITVPLNFQNGDFAQSLVGQYLYKVSSPVSPAGFSPVTNLFVVTNSFFSSAVTGAVENATSFTNIPNAIVLLCLNQNGPLVVQAGTVANAAGTFSLRAPPGNYFMAAAKSNFVEDAANSGLPLLQAKTTTNGTVDLNSANTNITGRVIDAANSNGLAGVSGIAASTNGLLSLYFTDTNGNFYAPVTESNFWGAPVNAFAAAFQGCLTWQTNVLLNVSNKTVSLTNTLPAVTAIFYGVVSNSSAVPMPGVYVYAADNANHQSVGMTDSHGKYVVGVSAGTNTWQLSILWPDNPGLTNTSYVFGPGYVQTNGIQIGQAIQQSFSVVYAPYTIGGTVADLDGNPIAGVEMFATNASDQAFSTFTASDGTYLLNVIQGTWTVGINPVSLENLGYTNVPANQPVTITESDVGGVNFSVVVCGEIEILTTNLPDAMAGQYYDATILAQGCQDITNWAPAYGITLTSIYDHTNVTYPAGTAIYLDTQLIGFLETPFSFGNATGNPDHSYFINCSGTTSNPYGAVLDFANLSATVDVTGPINSSSNTTISLDGVNWTATPTTTTTTTNGTTAYSTTLTLAEYPGNPISPGNGYAVNVGDKMTLPSGTSSNRVASVLGAFHSIGVFGNSMIAASSIPYTNQDNSAVWIGTNKAEYYISAYGPQSTNMDGLSVYPNGSFSAALSGTPISTNSGTFNFSVMAEDTGFNVTVQPLSIYVYPQTGFTGPSSAQAGMLQSSNTFQMQVSGVVVGLNYTVLMSTNLTSTNWVSIYTTNAPNTAAFLVPDTSATDSARFYRLQISQ